MVCIKNCIAVAVTSEILSQNHAATPTHVGGVKGFAAKTLGFCMKEHYHRHGMSRIVLNLLYRQIKQEKFFTSNIWISAVHSHEPTIPLQSLQLHFGTLKHFS